MSAEKRTPRIGYQTLYLWTCADCGAVWRVRKRPRDGKRLVCQREPEQELHHAAGRGLPCGAVFESNGSRSGLAT